MNSGIGLIVRRSLRQHALSTVVTVASAALGCGLVMAVFAVSSQSEQAFAGGKIGFDAVLGARGSQLQLVLNAVFHLETSPGNVPWSTYVDLKEDRRVARAVPYAVGDNYAGFRVVGTTAERFDVEVDGERVLRVRAGGRMFDPTRREAVVGATVARATGLTVGSHIHPSHGIRAEGGHEHDEEYLVVGVLEPSNSPNDRVVWIPIDGIFRMGGHFLRGAGEVYQAKPGEPIPDEHKEVSAVLLDFRGDSATGRRFDQEINLGGKDATLAWPVGKSMAELFHKLGWVNRILELVAYLVVVVAAGSILASLYNTMNERRREFAILRALGARRRTVFAVILGEAGVIAALGAVLGFAVYFGILVVASSIVESQTGVVLDTGFVHPALLWAPLGTLALGALAGLLPAFSAYRTDVAAGLVPAS